MKKVLSVAMASAMVLGMGANAFAIQYSTGSSDTAAWPKGFQFEGSLFVTDEDGNIVKSTITDLNGKTRVDFMPGDTIWMPLYADNQRVYEVEGYKPGTSTVDSRTEYLHVEVNPAAGASENGVVPVDRTGKVLPFTYEDSKSKVVYYYNQSAPTVPNGWRTQEIKVPTLVKVDGDRYVTVSNPMEDVEVKDPSRVMRTADASIPALTVTNAGGAVFNPSQVGQVPSVKVSNGSASVIAQAKSITAPYAVHVKVDLTMDQLKTLGVTIPTPTASEKFYDYVPSVEIEAVTMTWATAPVTTAGTETVLTVYDSMKVPATVADLRAKVVLPEIKGTSADLGVIVGDNEDKVDAEATYVDHGHYTGNIDKNWSINLIEEDNGVADLVEKAELYKADEVDYLSYKDHTEEIVPNGVYLKVTLKDTWKLADDADLKYYVYVADNKSGKETNKVWVSGTYAASYEYVDFTWTNDASKPTLWKVKDGENGVAVFDFADKAFFQVKMYSKESMYLDLSTAYDKAIAGDFSEADAFFSFDNENANFSRTGTLILVSDDASLIPYQVTEDGYTKVDAEYVEDFAIAHTNEKVDGFVFETKELGNYVLSTEEVEVEEDDKDDNTQEVVVPDTDNNETNNNSKPNPITGAEDFVGLAVSLAVVSVAAAGALALKK